MHEYWNTACDTVHTWWDGLSGKEQKHWTKQYKIPPVEVKDTGAPSLVARSTTFSVPCTLTAQSR